MYSSAKQEVTKVVSLVQSETKATKFLQSLKLQAFLQYKISRATAFPTILHVRPAKTQITMHIRAVSSESLQCTLREAKHPKRLQMDSEDTD